MLAVTADATIAALALVAAAGIPGVLAVLSARKSRQVLGEPNGHGTIAGIGEAILSEMAAQKEHLRAIAAHQEAHSLLDTLRFRQIHEHLGIPYDYDEDV